MHQGLFDKVVDGKEQECIFVEQLLWLLSKSRFSDQSALLRRPELEGVLKKHAHFSNVTAKKYIKLDDLDRLFETFSVGENKCQSSP